MIPHGVIIDVQFCVLQFVYIFAFGLGILGAMNYNDSFVVVALVSQGFNLNFVVFCQEIWGHGWVGIVVNAVFVYPHVTLLKELNNGILAPNNYGYVKKTQQYFY